jgi:tetratricopeptide (TPR) repeat protein
MLAAVAAQAQINTEQVMRIGRNSLYFEDYVLSIQYFNQVIKAKPFLAEPYFFRAVAKINLEDYQGAEADATLAIDRNPFIVDAYQVRGVARQNLHNFEGAIADYDKGLELMPEEKVFLMNRAVCHDELKNFDEAQASYDRLLRLDPKNDRAYLGLAHLNLARKDSTAALLNLARSIELSKNNASAYVMRAEIEMRSQHDYEAALADMNEAIKLEPNYAGYFVNRAYMKYHLDDYFGAMADYDYAVSLDPNNMEAHFNRAMLQAEVGENNKAIENFSKVLKNDPQNFMALYNRAMLYMRTGQYRKAISDMDKVLEKYPKFEAGYMARGGAKRQLGDLKGEKADYDHALAIFKSKKTRVSDFNPAEVEVEAAIQRAKERAEMGFVDEPETQDEIMERFNTLLTVAPENPIKPEYDNKQRGRIQNSNVEVEPEPMVLLTYYVHDNKLNGNTYYMREVAEVNDSRLLPATLSLASGDQRLGEQEINRHFASIEYYNSLLSGAKPRAVDYFARGMDYLMVRDPDAAIADADRAIATSPEFTLAYFLRANARYMKYRMAQSGAETDVVATTDVKAQAMLHQREDAQALQQVVADLDQVLKRSPRNVYAHFDKGNAYMLMNDYTGAISSFTKALEVKPDLGEAYYNRGLMYLRLGNKALGVADLSKAGELGILPSYNVLKRMTK